MAVLTRQQLLDLDSNTLGQLTDALPSELQDNLMLLLVDLLGSDELEVPDVYLEGIIDDL